MFRRASVTFLLPLSCARPMMLMLPLGIANVVLVKLMTLVAVSALMSMYDASEEMIVSVKRVVFTTPNRNSMAAPLAPIVLKLLPVNVPAALAWMLIARAPVPFARKVLLLMLPLLDAKRNAV